MEADAAAPGTPDAGTDGVANAGTHQSTPASIAIAAAALGADDRRAIRSPKPRTITRDSRSQPEFAGCLLPPPQRLSELLSGIAR